MNQMQMHDARKLLHLGQLRGARVLEDPMEERPKFYIQVVADPAVVEQYGDVITRQRGGVRYFSSIDSAATTVRDIGFRTFEVTIT